MHERVGQFVDECGWFSQACEKRVEEEDEHGQKHCTGQYFDFWGCIDKCVSLSQPISGADVLLCQFSYSLRRV
jgi:hypothetical protein